MNDLKSVREVAEIYNVTESAVRKWIKKGLEYKTEKVIGIRPRMIFNLDDIDNFLKKNADIYKKRG